jgi:class 3 adenylate cyclase
MDVASAFRPRFSGGSARRPRAWARARSDQGESARVSGVSVSSRETSPSIATIVEEVGADLPGYREKTSPDGMLTVGFTDIERSTEMMERLGENRWVEVMFTHNRIVRDCVREHRGEVVKSCGDGFMIAFASASAALDCAVELQRMLSRHNAAEPDQTLRVRVGLHTGNMFQLEDDFLGKAVVLAACITGHARGGEILVSADCREYTRRVGRWRYGAAMELRLKGLASSERVYRLDWSVER